MLLLLFAAAFVAFAVSTVAGGGAGLVLIPIIGLCLPAAEVPAALSVGTAASSVSRIIAFRSAVRWRLVARFVPAALPCVAIGAWLLSRVQPLYLELAIGAFLACNLVVMGRRGEAAQRPGTGWLTWPVAGAVGGFLSGFTGAVGLVLNDFYLRRGLSKEEVVATRAANEILLHLVKLGLYAGLGLFSRDALLVGGLIAVAAALAPLMAQHLVARLAERTFMRIGRLATCVAGLIMFGSAGASLAAQHGVSVAGHVGRTKLAARLNWSGGAASLNWRRGHPLEFERTIDIVALPDAVRAKAEQWAQGATQIVCERVLHWGDRAYEITVVRNGAVSKYKV